MRSGSREIIDERARAAIHTLGIRLGWDAKSFEDLENQLVHGTLYDSKERKPKKQVKEVKKTKKKKLDKKLKEVEIKIKKKKKRRLQ